MSFVLRELEDVYINFVKERVAEVEWEDITCANDIFRRMTEDDDAEFREYVFELVKREVSWGRILGEIAELAREATVIEDDPCEYAEEQEEEEQ
jgi:hypothetical protein